MTNYRRHYVPGGTVFFTVNLAERSKHLLVEYIDRLREAFRLVKFDLPFEIDAIVIYPADWAGTGADYPDMEFGEGN